MTGAHPPRAPGAGARLAALGILLSLCGCAPQATALLPPGNLTTAVFTRYSPLSRTAEIARRTLTPLTVARGEEALSVRGQALREQSIDLTKEEFTVYLPAGPPPKSGYGLLVFVAPWPEATRPQIWRPPLDRHGLIFVSAARSGNEATILDRRLPLALLAYENIRARYPIDSKRVYIGGLSGGARAAQVTALAYPDIFHGALLNAGSDPIGGEAGIYLPPADLFRKFQQTRLVYVTGEHDAVNQHDDALSQASMRDWCVFDLKILVARGLSHEPLDRRSLDLALDALEQPPAVDAGALARCNARIQQELAAKLSGAAAAIAGGDGDGARAQLNAIDGNYGGLAAPAIVDLDAKLAALRR